MGFCSAVSGIPKKSFLQGGRPRWPLYPTESDEKVCKELASPCKGTLFKNLLHVKTTLSKAKIIHV
jgi:hypothetical protein